MAIQVRRGEICGFLGPNGSGKTTTIRMLCGLLEPDAGEGTCLGHDIRRDARRIKLRVGKDWNNKLQNWPTVRESGNARRVKEKWLPWVGSDKFRSMMRESFSLR